MMQDDFGNDLPTHLDDWDIESLGNLGLQLVSEAAVCKKINGDPIQGPLRNLHAATGQSFLLAAVLKELQALRLDTNVANAINRPLVEDS